jgi:hypothetical protein
MLAIAWGVLAQSVPEIQVSCQKAPVLPTCTAPAKLPPVMHRRKLRLIVIRYLSHSLTRRMYLRPEYNRLGYSTKVDTKQLVLVRI